MKKMKTDELTFMYMVSKIHGAEELRRITSYEEQYRVLRNRGRELDTKVDIDTKEGLEFFQDLKGKVVGDENTPLKIFEDNEMFYYLSPDEKKGIVFLDEHDAQKLFLEIEQTLENFQETLQSGKSK